MEICPCSDVTNTDIQNAYPVSLKDFLDNCMYINVMFWEAYCWNILSCLNSVVACVFRGEKKKPKHVTVLDVTWMLASFFCSLSIASWSWMLSLSLPPYEVQQRSRLALRSGRQWGRFPERRSYFVIWSSLLLKLYLVSLWEVLFFCAYLDQCWLINNVFGLINIAAMTSQIICKSFCWISSGENYCCFSWGIIFYSEVWTRHDTDSSTALNMMTLCSRAPSLQLISESYFLWNWCSYKVKSVVMMISEDSKRGRGVCFGALI